MSYYPINLKGGQDYYLNVPGSLILLDSVGVAGAVDITPIRNGGELTTIPGRVPGFKYPVDFEALKLRAEVDTTIGIFAAFHDISIGITDGSSIKIPDGVKVTNTNAEAVPVKNAPGAPIEITNPAGQRINVDIGAGVVNVTADNVGVSNTDVNPVPVRNQALTTFVHQAPVAVGVAATALISDATLKKLVIRNDHATAKVALGGAGVTLANGAHVLLPGDMWEERDAAGAAWYAISDTAATNVQVTGIK